MLQELKGSHLLGDPLPFFFGRELGALLSGARKAQDG